MKRRSCGMARSNKNADWKLGFAVVLVALGLSGTWFSNIAWARGPSQRINQYVHNSWRSEDGLPQNSVDAILQTRDGYLWVGTEEGLVRFNGVQFTVFN